MMILKVSSRSSLLNHVDFGDYDTLHETLVKQNFIEDETIGMIKQGYHVYSGIILKKKASTKWRGLEERKSYRLPLFFV